MIKLSLCLSGKYGVKKMNLKITDVRGITADSAFLIDDGTTSIVCDSGFSFTGEKVAEKVALALGERKLDYIFLTHSHYDHVLGSLHIKKRFPEAKVVSCEYAAKIFEKPTARAVMRDMDNKAREKYGAAECEDLIDNLKVDITLKDGEVIKAGDMEFTLISFPGHTKCSTGYYLKKDKFLIGSETLGIYGGDGVVAPSYLVGYEMTLDSISRAEKLDIEKMLVPHYGVIDKEEVKTYLREGRRNVVAVAKEISSMIENGKTEEDAFLFFKDKFFHGYIREIWPEDAMALNTGIMVKLIKKELLGQ